MNENRRRTVSTIAIVGAVINILKTIFSVLLYVFSKDATVNLGEIVGFSRNHFSADLITIIYVSALIKIVISFFAIIFARVYSNSGNYKVLAGVTSILCFSFVSVVGGIGILFMSSDRELR